MDKELYLVPSLFQNYDLDSDLDPIHLSVFSSKEASMDSFLRKMLSEWSNSTNANDLAFSSLTSKSERYIQDSISLFIHNNHFDKYIVAKEHNHADIAIFDNQFVAVRKPLCTIELTFCYSFDVLKEVYSQHYAPNLYKPLKKTDDDEEKNRRNFPESEFYSLLLVAHSQIENSTIAEEQKRVLKIAKYKSPKRPKWDKSGAFKDILKECAAHQVEENIRSKDRFCVCSGEINSGRAFGIGVSLKFWLLKKKLPNSGYTKTG